MDITITIPDDANWGMSEKGFRPKTAEQYFLEIEEEAKQMFGQDTKLSNGNTLGQIIDTNCRVAADLNNLILSTLSQAYIDWLIGNSLDWFGEGRGLVRKKGTHAYYNELEIIGEIGYKLVRGAIVVSGGGVRYEIINDIDFDVSDKIAQIVSIERGEGTGSVENYITELEEPNSSIYSINNPELVVSGDGTENDDTYRERIKQFLNITTGSTVDAIKSSLLANDTVNFASVFENNTDEQITIKGHDIDPGHILSVVFGSDMESAARTQFDTRPAGIPTDGGEEFILKSLSEQDIPERILQGVQVQTYIKIEFTGEQPYFEEDTKNSINKKIIDYYGKRIGPGSTLSWKEIRGRVEGHDDIVAENVEVYLSKDNEGFIQEDIDFDAEQMAIISGEFIYYE